MLTLQLFDNFENDTLCGRSKVGGWAPHGGGGLVSQALVGGTCRASMPCSDQMGVGMMVPQFILHQNAGAGPGQSLFTSRGLTFLFQMEIA